MNCRGRRALGENLATGSTLLPGLILRWKSNAGGGGSEGAGPGMGNSVKSSLVQNKIDAIVKFLIFYSNNKDKNKFNR